MSGAFLIVVNLSFLVVADSSFSSYPKKCLIFNIVFATSLPNGLYLTLLVAAAFPKRFCW